MFFVWKASEKQLNEFLHQLNDFQTNLKSTRETLIFLDVIVKVHQGDFITDLIF